MKNLTLKMNRQQPLTETTEIDTFFEKDARNYTLQLTGVLDESHILRLNAAKNQLAFIPTQTGGELGGLFVFQPVAEDGYAATNMRILNIDFNVEWTIYAAPPFLFPPDTCIQIYGDNHAVFIYCVATLVPNIPQAELSGTIDIATSYGAINIQVTAY